ncbi:MAG: hypothetical protein RL000_280 [Bacteroidota bacterium]|jgi:uncharacterized membrane protein YqaE (UPF0057 family)
MKKSVYILTVIALISIFHSTAMAAILPPTKPADAKTAVIINESVSEFKNLSKTEKKERISKVKAAIQQYKTNLKLGEKIDDNKLLAIIFAILIPPVGVVLYENKVTTKFWISLLLTFIFWLPGMIYSLLVVTDNA